MKDSKGFTPLHLAVKAAEEIRSTRSIRHLLLKGADISIENAEGLLPVEQAEHFKMPLMKREIQVLLKEDKTSIFGDCLMIRAPIRKTVRSRKTVYFFLALMFFGFALLYVAVYPIVAEQWVKVTHFSLFWVCIVL